jgi:hypothetical protein
MSYARSLLCAVLTVVLFATSNASAQDCGQFDRTEFNTVTQNAEMQMATLEKIANVTLDTGVLYGMDEQRTIELMNGFANNYYRAFQIATAAADQAASTQGAQGDGRLITDFELAATRYESRGIALALKWEKIHAGLVQNQIRRASVDPQQGAPGFMQQFNQEGQQLAFRGGEVLPEFQQLVARGQQEQQSFGGYCQAAASAIGNLLIPSAHAAQALPCISPCSKKDWAACGLCVAAVGGVAASSWSDFVNCWNSSNSGWGKAWCLAKFIAKLA